jgi:hypothetical protein
MKITIDLRSAVIGLVLGVVLMFTLGATIEGPTGRPTSPTGRYQATGTSFHAVIIDTTTGEAWTAHLPEHGGGAHARFTAPKAEKK